VTRRGSGPDYTLEAASPGPVCGVDEAGRGPWAGPVSAAAVILDPTHIPEGLNDSKALSERRRDALEIEIKAAALAWGVGFASVEEIDGMNILQATGLAMRRAVEALAIPPACILVDGSWRFDLPAPPCGGASEIGALPGAPSLIRSDQGPAQACGLTFRSPRFETEPKPRRARIPFSNSAG